MTDQLLLHDQAVLTWVNSNFPSLLVGRTTQVLVATPRKAFAEATSGLVVDNRKLTTPRVSITRLGTENDFDRANANPIRRLGYCDDPLQKRLLKANYPAPINVNYQIDLWTRYVSEINLWERYIMETFPLSYMYLTWRPNDTWGDKYIPVFLDSPIRDNSDLEPGEGERLIRRTLDLRAESFFFPDTFNKVNVVKRIETIFIDLEDGVTEYDRSHLPPKESIGTGDGSAVTFGATLERWPVFKDTLVVQTVIGGNTVVAHDDGAGNLVGDNVSSGSIAYSTGVMSITYDTAPDVAADVFVTYFTDLS